MNDADLDRYRSIALHGIERHSEWVKLSAENIGRYTRDLLSCPPYETEAENTMRAAETALSEALLAVKLAIAEYERLTAEELTSNEDYWWLGNPQAAE